MKEKATYFKLLGEPARDAPPFYRGAYRFGPAYQEGLPETAPPNRTWREYVAHEERLSSRELALRLSEEFEQAGQRFDVVQFDSVPKAPQRDLAGQLGFDICWQGGDYSLLSWGLHWNERPSLPPPPKGPLFKLIEAQFQPLLNENGLFSTWSDARFFLDVVEAISTMMPGTWEAPGHEQFEIIRLVSVRPLAQGRAETRLAARNRREPKRRALATDPKHTGGIAGRE